MKIEVFKSEYTGELFEKEIDYKLHIEKYKEEIKQDVIRAKISAKATELKETPRLTATSIEDFRQKAFSAITELNKGNPDQLVCLDLKNLRFTDVSNSHSAPIGKKTNWSQKESNEPTSYKGWYGTITIVFSEEKNTGDNRDRVERFTEQFPGINTGSGGYRGKEYNGFKGYIVEYELQLYLDDFPLIKKEYEEYIRLQEKRQEWQIAFHKLYEEYNRKDNILNTYSSTHLKLLHESKDLDSKIKNISADKLARETENKQIILAKFPFEEQIQYENLQKQF